MLLDCWEYRMNCGHTQGSVRILHRLAEGIWLCRLDLIQILNSSGIEWCETDWSANSTWIRILKYEWNKETKKVVKTGIWVGQGCCLSPSLFSSYRNYIIKEALEGFWDFKRGGQIIHIMIQANELVLLAEEGMQNQGSQKLFASNLKDSNSMPHCVINYHLWSKQADCIYPTVRSPLLSSSKL